MRYIVSESASKRSKTMIVETTHNEAHFTHPVIVLTEDFSVVRIERARDGASCRVVGYGDQGRTSALTSGRTFRGKHCEAKARTYGTTWIAERNARIAAVHADSRAWLAEGNESESTSAQLRVAEKVCSCASCEGARNSC
jgi:hypothetical protein